MVHYLSLSGTFTVILLNRSLFFVTRYLVWPGNEEPGHMVEGQTFTIGEWSTLFSKINIASVYLHS